MPSSLPTISSLDCVKVVGSFEELISEPLSNGINAACWPRVLDGDFAEVINHIGDGDGVRALEEDFLRSLNVSHSGKVAIDIMLNDRKRLADRGLDPLLNCIYGYPEDESSEVVATDVFSFHADSAPVEAETWLCTYYGSSSEGLRNQEAIRRIDIPSIRAELLKAYGGQDDDEFCRYLTENCYDLHYTALPNALPYVFGVGNLWKIAVEYPGNPVKPCIHRAPRPALGEPSRLLLIC